MIKFLNIIFFTFLCVGILCFDILIGFKFDSINKMVHVLEKELVLIKEASIFKSSSKPTSEETVDQKLMHSAKQDIASNIEVQSTDGSKNTPVQPTIPKPTIPPSEVLLDVPLLNQMDAPRLYNGCEVTSLAMMMNYYGVDVSKNELATKITRVPLNYGDGKKGNPNVGFVGNMEDGPGLGVYDEPIYLLAKRYMGSNVTNLTKQPFEVLIEKVAQGAPVWVITTTSFAPVAPLDTWTTPQGPVGITFKMHSVVITGYDQDSIYINDPYGFKNRKVNKENFIKAWEQMGSKAVVLGEV